MLSSWISSSSLTQSCIIYITTPVGYGNGSAIVTALLVVRLRYMTYVYVFHIGLLISSIMYITLLNGTHPCLSVGTNRSAT